MQEAQLAISDSCMTVMRCAPVGADVEVVGMTSIFEAAVLMNVVLLRSGGLEQPVL